MDRRSEWTQGAEGIGESGSTPANGMLSHEVATGRTREEDARRRKGLKGGRIRSWETLKRPPWEEPGFPDAFSLGLSAKCYVSSL